MVKSTQKQLCVDITQLTSKWFKLMPYIAREKGCFGVFF